MCWTNLGCSVRGSNRAAMIWLSTFVSAVLLIVAAASSPTPVTSASGTESTSHVKLNHFAKSRGKLYFGTATDNGELTDKAYTTILDDNTMFGQITPANSMKWVSLSSSSGTASIHNLPRSIQNQSADISILLAETSSPTLRNVTVNYFEVR